MQKYYTIKVPLTENDIQDLQAGESFNWTFETNEDPTISINVQLVPEEYEEEEEQSSDNCEFCGCFSFTNDLCNGCHKFKD